MAKKKTELRVKKNRVEEAKRDKKLDANVKSGADEMRGILADRKKAVAGVLSGVSKPKFLTNAQTRNKLFAELAEEYKELNIEVDEWVKANALKTSEDFHKYAKKDLPKGAVSGTFGQFSEKYFDDLVSQINPSTVEKTVAMNAAIGGMQQNDIRTLRAAVSTTIAEGAVEGLTNKQMSDRMLGKVVGKAGQFTFIDKAGRNWSADNYFGMLNRTLHSTAARQSYIDTATKEAGFDLFTIAGGVTGSSVENPNDPCDNWAGRIISMTGNTEGYPTAEDAESAGVFHPQCVHFYRVVLPSEIEAAELEEDMEKKESERLSTTIA